MPGSPSGGHAPILLVPVPRSARYRDQQASIRGRGQPASRTDQSGNHPSRRKRRPVAIPNQPDRLDPISITMCLPYEVKKYKRGIHFVNVVANRGGDFS
jgi:hypothetical protein